jgi:hypothetical protein
MHTAGLLGLGLFGAAIPECLRVVACLRGNKLPSGKEFAASVIMILLGSGVLLFDLKGVSAFQVAVLGSAFPSLFSAATAAATLPESSTHRGGWRLRRLRDYLAWRLT